MSDDCDHYEAYYADKLWNLLPAVYRTEDTDVFDKPGPLRELVNRIGVQAAILRRSIDRLWEDQSIETCDDWVIPYSADLLATRLVASLDAPGQRLDVAKTIYYRRRKGTVAILEEIITDITGWQARVVEFFRRLARSRHGLDPEIGLPSATEDPVGNRDLQLAQGLIGTYTNTASGGWADLRKVYGAAKAYSAFDEFFHTADLRRGHGQVGWYNIPHLGVFLWRLQSFEADHTTPVAIQGCPDQYSFDPTGREIPLFAAAELGISGDNWVPREEWQLPTAISKLLFAQETANLYPDPSLYPDSSVGVLQQQGSSFATVAPAKVTIYPEIGRFKVDPSLQNATLLVRYHYGFSSTIGAGPYDRRILGGNLAPTPGTESTVSGGGDALVAPLGSVAPTGTVTIDDSLTYAAVSDVGGPVTGIQQVTVRAANTKKRPLIRLAPPPPVTEWAFTGADGSELAIEGLFISSGDIVLRGNFDSVTLTCCTLDPGNSGNPPAVDGRPLLPCHLWVEGQVRQLTISGCIVGPIATRGSGEIETLTVSDSIVQALDGDKAIQLTNGAVNLSRCTLLGPAQLHWLSASECILHDIVQVQDWQQGCVRFSAWASGSTLPRQYESVQIAPQAPLFTTRDFGQPGYAQLQANVDAAILAGKAGASIAVGAQDGSEMGAFAREKNPIKERSLLLKLGEFMPLGLSPVIIYVT